MTILRVTDSDTNNLKVYVCSTFLKVYLYFNIMSCLGLVLPNNSNTVMRSMVSHQLCPNSDYRN